MSAILMSSGFTLITGKRGSGKTLSCMRFVIDELCEGKRNVGLWIPGFNRHALARALENRGKPRIWAWQRVFELSEDEAVKFWEHRGGGVHKPFKVKKVISGTPVYETIDYTGDPGVLYIIDEIGLLYSARNWRKAEGDLRQYFILMRRMNDVVIGTTIRRAQVNVDLRDLMDEYVRMVNLGRHKLWGMRLGSAFWLKSWPADSTGRNVPCSFQKWFYLPKDLCDIYNTAMGPGVVGSGAETGAKQKGVWFGWTFLVAIIIIVTFANFPKGCRMVSERLKGNLGKGLVGVRGGMQEGKPNEKTNETPVAAVATSVSNAVHVTTTTSTILQKPSVAIPRMYFQSKPKIDGRIVSVTTVKGHKVFGLADGKKPLWNPRGAWDGKYLRLDSGELYEWNP